MKKYLSIVLLLCMSVYSYGFKTGADSAAVKKINQKLESVGCKWKFVQVVDKFGDPTDEVYLIYEMNGTFSNTAVENQRFCGKIRYFTEKSGEMVFHDYCNYDLKAFEQGFSSDLTPVGECRPNKGEKKFQSSFMGIPLLKMENILMDTTVPSIKVVFGRETVEYRFTIDKTGAKEIVNAIKYLKAIK